MNVFNLSELNLLPKLTLSCFLLIFVKISATKKDLFYSSRIYG